MKIKQASSTGLAPTGDSGTPSGSAEGSDNLVEVATEGARLSVDLGVGHIRELVFSGFGTELRPLHTAPWVLDMDERAKVPDETPPVERWLSGDFLCAPFASRDVEGAPLHGWTANSEWEMVEVEQNEEHAYLKLRLLKKVLGATVEKELLVMANVPLLYQSHRFVGGEGSLPVAHHVMTRMKSGGMVCHSPIALAYTGPESPVPNGSLLKYPADSREMSSFPKEEGGTANLGEFPIAGGYEDTLTLVEREDSRLGWTAVQRKEEQDIVFVVKDPAVLPQTMMWHSNGGRWHKPWNSSHFGVLGIEDGASFGFAGLEASAGANPLSDKGFATCVDLVPDGEVEVNLLLGAVARPETWTRTTAIESHGDTLLVRDRRGEEVAIPLVPSFFGPHTRHGEADGRDLPRLR